MSETRASYTPNLIYPTLYHYELEPEAYARLRMRFDLYDDVIIATRYDDRAESVFAVDPVDLAQGLGGLTASSGLLPPGCLFWGRKNGFERLAIYVEPKIWPLSIKGHKQTWHVPLPGLIFIGRGTKYRIYAVKDRQPGANTVLYRFPSPNVDIRDSICGGNAPFPQASASQIVPALHTFFESVFNNHLSDSKSAAYPDSILDMWQNLDEKGATAYPLGDLVEAGHTLKGVIG